MFAKDKVSQSLIDAVNKVVAVTEAKADELPPIDKSAAAARKARQARLDAIEDAKSEKGEGEKKKTTSRTIAGKAYGGSKQKDDDEMDESADNPGPVRKQVPSSMEKPSKEDMAAWHAKQKEKHVYKKEEVEMDESGLRMAAHAAHKAGQKHFEFQGKKYPVRVSEDGSVNCDYNKVKSIAKKEVQGHEKSMHKESIVDTVKNIVSDSYSTKKEATLLTEDFHLEYYDKLKEVNTVEVEHLTEEETNGFHPNVHAELKKHSGKIGAIMHNTKDNVIAAIVHNTKDNGLSGKHHVHFFCNDKKVHTTVHPTFGDAEQHGFNTITTKSGLKHLKNMHTLIEEEVQSLNEVSADLVSRYSDKASKEYNDPKTSARKKDTRRAGLMLGYNKAKGRANVPATYEEMSFAERLLERARLAEARGPLAGAGETFTDNNIGEMSDAQAKKKEKIVMSMKKREGDFKAKYGKNWKNVMYATATKLAMAEDYVLDEDSEMAKDIPFEGPYSTKPATVKDKSGAVHTPMSRVKTLARQAMKKLTKETMMGKSATSEEIENE